MANIRKTFNFRNGVQVDEDNFIVDSLGKVGVGTTVPNQMLDVRGDAKVVGIITSQSIETRNVNVAGVTTFSGTTHVGAAITMYPAAGIISARQFHGDGTKLINIPTSQWTDVDVGLGFTSIYNEGFVGIATVDPRFTLQIGGNDDLTTFANGVGINSSGNMVVTGVVTATNFKGDLQGNVTGTVTAAVTATSINNTGVSTFQDDCLWVGAGTPNKFATWDKSDSRFEFSDDAGLMLGGAADFEIIHSNNESIIRDTRAGAASTLAIGADKLILRNKDGNENYLEATDNGSVKIYYDFAPKLETRQEGIQVTGIASAGQFTGNVNAGVATVTSSLNLGGVSKLGVQTSTPQSQFHVFNAGISSVQVESGSGAAILSLGTNVNKRQTSGEIVYGKNTLTYSDTGSLDVINYNNSHLNNIIHLGSQVGLNTGNWNWVYGKAQSAPKMTLTYEGNLGIGKTNAATALDVVGVATVSNDSFVGGSSWVASNQTIQGNLTVNGTNNLSIAGKNLDVTTGHSRVKNVNVTNALTVVGFSTFTGNVSVGGTLAVGKFNYTNDDGKVAITTNTFSNPDSVGVDARHTQVIARGIGVGRTTLTAAVDFSNAGRNNHDVVVPAGEVNRMYMIPPKVSNAERGNLTGVVAGALIYNTTSNKLQCHNGSGWQDCF